MRRFRFVLMLLSCFIATQRLVAYDFIKDGIAYSITDVQERTVTVVPADSMYAGDIVIPAVVTYEAIPYTVTAIGDKAFNDYSGIYDENQSLLSVSIPKHVKTIGVDAFRRCVNLNSVTFADDAELTTVGVRAFFHCDSLKQIDLPNSVRVIGGEAFEWAGLERIYIGPNITIVGDPSTAWALGEPFDRCNKLNRIDISDLAAWCGISFYGGSLLKWGHNLYLNGELITDLVIPKSVKKINPSVFAYWHGNSVTFNDSINEIGQSAFAYSTIREINFPDKTQLQVLGDNAFSYCDSLLRVDLPKSDSLYAVGSYYSYIEGDGWHRYDQHTGDAFTYCQSLETITVSSSVTHINFSYNPKLKNVIFPADCHIKEISSGCFSNCYALESFEIPSSVTSLGQGVFQNCTSLKKVTIPASVTELNTVGNLGSSYKIHSEFSGCDSLQEVYCYITEPFATGEPYWNDENNVENVTLYVPQGTKAAYDTLYSWNFFGNIVEMDVRVDSLRLSTNNLTTIAGEIDTLGVEVFPANATYPNVAWSSSDTTIVKVDDGIITAIAVGSAVITAAATDEGGVTACCTVTVIAPPANSVSINENTAALYVGDSFQLTASISPAAASQSVTWNSSNTAVATVSTSGLITAVAAGTATITATTADGTNKTASCTVTVKAPSATSVSLNKTTLTLTTGATGQLTATVSPSTASQSVTWKSSNTAVATVSTAGVVTAVAPGTATITATTTDGTNKTASCTVTVKSTYTVGDINNDKELNVGDLSRLVKMILDEYSTQDDTFKAADVNGDGELNVGDYSKLVKIILDAPAAGSKAFQGAALSKGYRSAAVSLTSDDIAIGAGQTKLLAVQLSNYDKEFNAVQFDIQLPKGLEIDSEATETAVRTSGFGIATNGTRVILSNTRDHAISGSEGDILYLAVKADADIQLGSYEVEFDNVLLSTMESEVVRAEGFYSTIMAEDLTGISSATSNINPQSSKVYDLQGRKVTGKPHKGIYIIDGKKKSL